MRSTRTLFVLPVAAALLAACGPQGPAAPGASSAPTTTSSSPASGASTAPTGGGTTTASAAPTGPIADLETKFPLPTVDGAKRGVTYALKIVEASGTKEGTETYNLTGCGASSCTSLSDRIIGGAAEFRAERQFPPIVEGMLVPYLYKDANTDFAAKIKAGGTEETLTVKAGTYKAWKISFGGSESYTAWYQKPYFLKVEYKGASRSSSMELQSIN